MHATTWDYAPIYTSHVATLQGARVAALTRAWRTQPLAGDKWVCVYGPWVMLSCMHEIQMFERASHPQYYGCFLGVARRA